MLNLKCTAYACENSGMEYLAFSPWHGKQVKKRMMPRLFERKISCNNKLLYYKLAALSVVFFGKRRGLVLGRTPPWAMVTPASNFPSSSSFPQASRICLGMIFFFFLSLAAFPANCSTLTYIYAKWLHNEERKTEAEIEVVVQNRKITKEKKHHHLTLQSDTNTKYSILNSHLD